MKNGTKAPDLSEIISDIEIYIGNKLNISSGINQFFLFKHANPISKFSLTLKRGNISLPWGTYPIPNFASL